MNRKIPSIIIFLMIFLYIITNVTYVFATNEKMQIVKKSEKEYLIYIENHIDSTFEFAFSNDKNADKTSLSYKNSARDMEKDDACHIAYIDEEIYDTYLSKDTYMWARKNNNEYIVEGLKIDLNDFIADKDIKLANTMTKRIAVDTTQSYTKPAEMKDDVKVTKTVGKVIVSENGTTEYILEKVPESGDLYEFVAAAQNVSAGKVGNSYYEKLESSKKIANLYNSLLPESSNTKWTKVTNGEILQPEEAHEGWQYVLWLKNVKSDAETFDAQFLTCFEDYKPEVVSEKVVSKLPVTSDDPTLFIILGGLLIATAVAVIVRISIGKKEKNKQ